MADVVNCGGLLIDGSVIVKDANNNLTVADATTTTKGTVMQAVKIRDSVAPNLGSLVTDFNLLLNSLRGAGILEDN